MLGGISFRPFYDADKTGGGGATPPAAGATPAADPGAAAAAAAAAATPAAKTGEQPGAAAPGATVDPGKDTLAGGADPGAAAAAAAAGATPKFPDNWRELLAGEDKKALTDLQRYTDPNAFYKGARELRAKIDSGEFKAAPKPLPADATPEQKAEWRKTNGLPATPEAYVEKLALPDGMVVGEADKPLVADFAKAMFESGASQDEMNRSVNWYYQMQDQLATKQAENDKQSIIDSQAELIGEWGPGDFKINMNAVGSLLATMPEDFRNALLTARTADGKLLGNTAALNRWAAQTARELNPAATIVPAGADSGKTISAELESIEATLRKAQGGDQEAHRAYYGYEGKPGLEVRMRELIDIQQKMAARGKAA
jgi:hypothetical protein